MNRELQIFIIMIMCPFLLISSKPGDHLKQLENRNENALTPKEKVSALLELGIHFRIKEFNNTTADSCFNLAIEIAEGTGNNELIFKAYKEFLESIPIAYENEECGTACNRLLEIAQMDPKEGRLFEAYLLKGRACLKDLLCKGFEAEHDAYMAHAEATRNQNTEQIIRANLLWGETLAKQDKITKAYKCYSDALLKMVELNDHEIQVKQNLLYQYNGLLFELYSKIRNYEKAQNCKQLQIDYLLNQASIDSMELMINKLELVDLIKAKNSNINIEYQYQEILDYAEKVNHSELKNYCLSSYRNWLISTKKLDQYADLMLNKYPEELNREWQYNIMAHIHEALGNEDSSLYFFKKEEKDLLARKNVYAIAHFYKRYGEYLKRQNDVEGARLNFEKSLYYGRNNKEARNLMIEVSRILEEKALKKNAFQEAYEYSNIHDSLKNERNKNENLDLSEMTIQSERAIATAEERRNSEAKKNRDQAQYFKIILIIFIVTFILLVISSMPVPVWLIEMLAFFSILSIFEFIILLMDNPIKGITNEEPIKQFGIKLVIFSILFPLHHLIETSVTNYLKRNKLLMTPKSFSFKKLLAKLWPWLDR